jgi:hypothetical protein
VVTVSNKRKSSDSETLPAHREVPQPLLYDYATLAGASRASGVPEPTLRYWLKSPSVKLRIETRDWHGTTVLRMDDVLAVALDPPPVGRKKSV